MILFFIVPLLLIMLQGLFAASETGLLSIEKMRVLNAKRKGQEWASRVAKFLNQPERFFSTILISENFIIVIASTLFAKFFIDRIGDNGAILSTIILSLFSLTIGLFIPKSLALSNPEKIMSYLGNIIYYIELTMFPIVTIYAYVSRGLAYFFQTETKTNSIGRSDIIYAISEYEEEARKFASRLFNFSKRRIDEVMIPLDRAFMCKKGLELSSFDHLSKRIFTRIPVYMNKKHDIIGIFNIKDYFYTDKITLRKPYFVNASDRCMTIFSAMKQQGEHMAIVLDQRKKPIGLVTLEDLLEELVGEIRDEA